MQSQSPHHGLRVGGHIHRSLVSDRIFRPPKTGDRLVLGVEVKATLAIECDITKEAPLISRPGELGERHGNGHVDPDLANVYFTLELAGRSS